MNIEPFKHWYSTKLIVIEMLKFHHNREMMFSKYVPKEDKLVMFKYTMINSFDRFIRAMGKNPVLDVYHHLETLKTHEMPWHLKKHNTWNTKIKKEIFNYGAYEDKRQWAFDIDADNDLLQAYAEAKHVSRYMKRKYKVKTSIIFSGSKGFHVDCDLYGPAQNVRLQNRTAYRKLLSNCPHLDHIYGRRRAWRTPYSLHSKSGLVCFPLGPRERDWLDADKINKFLEAMKPERVWNEVRIIGRGCLW